LNIGIKAIATTGKGGSTAKVQIFFTTGAFYRLAGELLPKYKKVL
jgi:hypothetical protein